MTDATTIVLEPDLARLVRDVVARGRHPSVADAIRSALEEYSARDDDQFGLSGDDVRRLWDAGLASGPGHEADFDTIKREVRRRVAAGTPDR